MFYAGIGSRETPKDILNVMTLVAQALVSKGWVLRSGGALGADMAFENGAFRAGGKTDIYLPWRMYNGHMDGDWEVSPEAIEMASQFHPAWHRCGQGARKLHGRNCHILLGKQLDLPVSFVICWTPGAAVTGGTGLGMRIAQSRKIEIYNLANPQHLATINSWIKEVLG